MHPNCQECTRLWSEYALVTRHFLNVEGKLRTAGVSHDRETVRELTPIVERAAAERARMRRIIEEHEARASESSGAAGA
jgi:hypothetical protein